MTLSKTTTGVTNKMAALHARIYELTKSGDKILECAHPLAHAAKLQDQTTPNYEEALNGKHAAQFKAAMDLEEEQLDEKDAWGIKPRSTIPTGITTVNAL